MHSKIIPIEEKLQLLSILSNGNSLIKHEDIIKEKKLKVNITNAISSIKAISLDTSIPNSVLKGKITTDNTKPILGIAIDSSAANANNEIVTNGVITDDSLTSGTIGQAVYINNSGSLSLVVSGLRVGRLLSTSSPIKVWINPGREYDELQEFLILERSLYFALRYLSYYLPFATTQNPFIDNAGIRGYGNGIMILAGGIEGEVVYSSDLNLFVSVATSGVNQITSTDGLLPSVQQPAPQLNAWISITYGNGLFVACSRDGVNRIMTSPDGINWTLRNASQANTWQSVTYGNGLFVCIASDGVNRIMTSPDGINWTNRNASQANQWKQIIFDGTQFVAAADSGTNRIMTSPDGINWTNQNGTSTVTGYIAYGNKTYLASTAIGYLISTDTILWKNTLEKNGGGALIYNDINGVFYGRYGGVVEYVRSAEI